MPARRFNFVHAAVQEQAWLFPTRVAVWDPVGQHLTYAELDRRSTQLASHLQRVGVRPDDRVAVWMERSRDLVISLLAVLKAGGAYVPIDASCPAERIEFMLRTANAAVVMTDLQAFPVAGSGRIVIRSDAACDDSRPLVDPGLDPDHLAYVIYTSGSTGAPKGVAMSHQGLTRLIQWQIGNGPGGLLTLQFTPVSFDVVFQEVFSTLCTGGTLFLASESLRQDPARLLATIHENGIQRLFLPFVGLQQLANAHQHLGLAPQSLQHIITAGERLIVTEAISALFCALPSCRLDNHYGPTEAHLITSFTLATDRRSWPTLPPIGSAVAGVTVYNLDDTFSPVPSGATGELYVAGEGLARGYLNAPDLTAERFLPDPFSTVPGARMYKTGDLVQGNAVGVFDFAGRCDNQLKVRGFRVEPGEVESVLANFGGIRQAAVGLRTLAEGVDALVAYVVTHGTPVRVAEISRHLRKTLPDYMVPARFIFLDSLPLTPSGKVDQRALSQTPIPSAGEVPATESKSLVQIVSAIWERVLGHNEFEPQDDFFDVGGDSLLATWVVTELKQALGQEIELSIVLEDSTITGIASALEALALRPIGEPRASEIATLRPGPAHRALFLVHPLGGEVLAYRPLARSLKSVLRVLGLCWQPEKDQAAQSLEEMAAAHVEQIRALYPEGPFLLAGWSFGGVLAFEMAQQIIRSGGNVDFLGLFDANPVLDPTTGIITRESPLHGRLTRVLEQMDRGLKTGDDGRIGFELLRADPDLSALLGSTIPEGVTAAHIRKNLQITRDSIWAAQRYTVAPYRDTIDLFQPAGAAKSMQDSLAHELRKLALGRLRTHSVPGDHYNILRSPQVEVMATVVDSVLAGVHTPSEKTVLMETEEVR